MIDLKRLREDPEGISRALSRRGGEYMAGLARVLDHDAVRRSLLQRVEESRHRIKTLSKDIGSRMRGGGVGVEIEALKEESQALSGSLKEMENQLSKLEGELEQELLFLPNFPHETTPDGKSPEDNPLIRTWGEKPRFSFPPKAHDELGERLGILDLKRAAKLSGARFALYRGPGALLARALITFMLELHIREHGYLEWWTPLMVTPPCMEATGQLPKFKEDLFSVDGGNYYLIPTAEVPVTNIHREEVLKGEELPLKYVAYTPCFRSEAGAYGKEVRGLIRQHQFDKVELVKFTTPEESYQELEALTRDAEEVLRRLGLHYRVVSLCTGDLGFAAAKTYDLEVWIPSQEAYREISSCSNFEDFQARRARIRFRRAAGSKPELVHTLNGSGLAVGRTVVALLEQFQQADGSVLIPEALRPYMGEMEALRPEGPGNS